jgi:hypothetical protein
VHKLHVDSGSSDREDDGRGDESSDSPCKALRQQVPLAPIPKSHMKGRNPWKSLRMHVLSSG